MRLSTARIGMPSTETDARLDELPTAPAKEKGRGVS